MTLAPPGAKSHPGGFTLLEVLAVCALVAVLTSLVLAAGSRAVATARQARARAELVAIAAALDAYKQIHGDYPRTDQPVQLLEALLGQRGPDSRIQVSGRPFLETSRFNIVAGELRDPWEQPYHYAYKVPAAGWANPRFVLYSGGPDASAFSRLTSGGFPDRNAAANLDNVSAGQN